MMLSYLVHYFGDDIIQDKQKIFNGIPGHELELVNTMLVKKINCPLTSSTGRLFDAVSALLNICKTASYHAEPPMRLESIAKETTASYPFDINDVITFKRTFEGILKDIDEELDVGIISGKFHNTIVNLILQMALVMRKKTTLNKVVLSGGIFQNRILLKKAEDLLKDANFAVFSQTAIPSNDGGIALGQLAIAAKKRELGII